MSGHLILPVGPPACGKSTLAQNLVDRNAFPASAIVSPDFFREMLTDERGIQDANSTVFDICNIIIRKRLARGLVVYHDATNYGRLNTLADMAHFADARITCISFDVSLPVLMSQNRCRPHPVPDHVLTRRHKAWKFVDRSTYPGVTITSEDALANVRWVR